MSILIGAPTQRWVPIDRQSLLHSKNAVNGQPTLSPPDAVSFFLLILETGKHFWQWTPMSVVKNGCVSPPDNLMWAAHFPSLVLQYQLGIEILHTGMRFLQFRRVQGISPFPPALCSLPSFPH